MKEPALNQSGNDRPLGSGSTTGPSSVDGGNPLSVLASGDLLRGQAAVLIEHLGQHYRLQATRQGKLILTK